MKLFKKLTHLPTSTQGGLPINRFTMFFLISACSASFSWAQTSSKVNSFLNFDPLLLLCPGVGQKKVDNEFAYSGEAIGNFYCNPLVLNGMAFDHNTFTLESQGELRLIKGDPKNGKVTEIPFFCGCEGMVRL